MHSSKAMSKRKGRRNALDEMICATTFQNLLPPIPPLIRLVEVGETRKEGSHRAKSIVASVRPYQRSVRQSGSSYCRGTYPITSFVEQYYVKNCGFSACSTTAKWMTLSGFLVILDYVGKIVYVRDSCCASGPVPGRHEMAYLLLAIGVQMCLGRRNAGITVDGYKPIHFNGRIIANDDCRFIGYGQPLVAYGLNEVRLSSSMWMFRTDLSLKMVFVDSRVAALTGYRASSLVDKSLYELVHVEDMSVLADAHINVLRQHQSITAYYRLLANCGGWLW
uniref:PAS domain-containing protein n=1 Tax=Ditylenchus dipsaci TaxID=166011 RepID=A0A915E2S6_9BILA